MSLTSKNNKSDKKKSKLQNLQSKGSKFMKSNTKASGPAKIVRSTGANRGS
jgi:hypothetical protein